MKKSVTRVEATFQEVASVSFRIIGIKPKLFPILRFSAESSSSDGERSWIHAGGIDRPPTISSPVTAGSCTVGLVFALVPLQSVQNNAICSSG